METIIAIKEGIILYVHFEYYILLIYFHDSIKYYSKEDYEKKYYI